MSIEHNSFMHTVVETPAFLVSIKKRMSDEETAEIVTFLASNPDAGDVIPGAGGVRKVRFARAGMGKRGGVRVIYYLHGTDMPLFILLAYAKAERENLTAEQQRKLAQYAEILKREFGG